MGVFRVYRVGSPYNAAELTDIDTVQSFDVMYIAHLNHAPTKLERFSHTDWLFEAVAFGPTRAPPTTVLASASVNNTDSANSGDAYFPQPASYIVTAIDPDSGQESRASTKSSCTNDLSLKRNYNTITCDGATGVSRYRVYKSNNDQDYGFIGSTTVAAAGDAMTFRDDYINPDLTVGPLTGFNPFASADDYPSTVCFFEQRLFWARSRNNPNAVWSSRSADFENMDVGVPGRADDSISIRLVSQGVNHANQLVPIDKLLAFSSNGIFSIEGSNADYLSASPPPRIKPVSGRGANRLSPIVIDRTVFFSPTNSSYIRQAGYDLASDGYRSQDVTIFSPQFFRGFSIVSWAYVEEPLSIIWAARSDGKLLAFTWEQEQQVWGWTICPLPNGGKVKSVCSISEPGPADADGVQQSENRLYAIIEFTLSGVTKQYRCRMASARWQGLALACNLDLSITVAYVDGEVANEIPGLWHLEGETVAAFVDGLVIENLVVSGGKVTLEAGMTWTLASVGLPYDAVAETLPLYLPGPGGTNAGRRHTMSLANIALVRSRAPRLAVRKDTDKGDVPDEQFVSMKTDWTGPLNEEASLLNGTYPCPLRPVVAGQAKLTIKHRIAPLTVTGVYLDPTVSGD